MAPRKRAAPEAAAVPPAKKPRQTARKTKASQKSVVVPETESKLEPADQQSETNQEVIVLDDSFDVKKVKVDYNTNGFPFFKDGDVYIKLGEDRRYCYQLHSSVLGRASKWFKQSLDKDCPELDNNKAEHARNLTGIAIRYELTPHDDLKMWSLIRTSLTFQGQDVTIPAPVPKNSSQNASMSGVSIKKPSTLVGATVSLGNLPQFDGPADDGVYQHPFGIGFETGNTNLETHTACPVTADANTEASVNNGFEIKEEEFETKSKIIHLTQMKDTGNNEIQPNAEMCSKEKKITTSLIGDKLAASIKQEDANNVAGRETTPPAKREHLMKVKTEDHTRIKDMQINRATEEPITSTKQEKAEEIVSDDAPITSGESVGSGTAEAISSIKEENAVTTEPSDNLTTIKDERISQAASETTPTAKGDDEKVKIEGTEGNDRTNKEGTVSRSSSERVFSVIEEGDVIMKEPGQSASGIEEEHIDLARQDLAHSGQKGDFNLVDADSKASSKEDVRHAAEEGETIMAEVEDGAPTIEMEAFNHAPEEPISPFGDMHPPATKYEGRATTIKQEIEDENTQAEPTTKLMEAVRDSAVTSDQSKNCTDEQLDLLMQEENYPTENAKPENSGDISREIESSQSNAFHLNLGDDYDSEESKAVADSAIIRSTSTALSVVHKSSEGLNADKLKIKSEGTTEPGVKLEKREEVEAKDVVVLHNQQNHHESALHENEAKQEYDEDTTALSRNAIQNLQACSNTAESDAKMIDVGRANDAGILTNSIEFLGSDQTHNQSASAGIVSSPNDSTGSEILPGETAKMEEALQPGLFGSDMDCSLPQARPSGLDIESEGNSGNKSAKSSDRITPPECDADMYSMAQDHAEKQDEMAQEQSRMTEENANQLETSLPEPSQPSEGRDSEEQAKALMIADPDNVNKVDTSVLPDSDIENGETRQDVVNAEQFSTSEAALSELKLPTADYDQPTSIFSASSLKEEATTISNDQPNTEEVEGAQDISKLKASQPVTTNSNLNPSVEPDPEIDHCELVDVANRSEEGAHESSTPDLFDVEIRVVGREDTPITRDDTQCSQEGKCEPNKMVKEHAASDQYERRHNSTSDAAHAKTAHGKPAGTFEAGQVDITMTDETFDMAFYHEVFDQSQDSELPAAEFACQSNNVTRTAQDSQAGATVDNGPEICDTGQEDTLMEDADAYSLQDCGSVQRTQDFTKSEHNTQIANHNMTVKDPESDHNAADLEANGFAIVNNTESKKPSSERKTSKKLDTGTSGSAPLPTKVVGPREDLIRAYHNLFLAYYSKDPIIDPVDIETALEEIELLVTVAGIYDSLAIIRPFINGHLLAFGQKLYQAIARDAARWVKLSILIKSPTIFKEGAIHIAGNYPTWGSTSTCEADLGAATIRLAHEKAIELKDLIDYIHKNLFMTSIRVDGEEVYVDGFDDNRRNTWFVVQLWRDWYCRSFARAKKESKKSVVQLYKTIGQGGDAYLPHEEVLGLLAGLRPGAKYDATDIKRIAEDLKLMKKAAQDIVKPICVNNSMLREVENIGYFTCIKVEDRDMPQLEVRP